MHASGFRKCRGGPWLTEADCIDHHASSKMTLREKLRMIEESIEDSSSYVSVQVNDEGSVDEVEWQTIQPKNAHKKNKKRFSAKQRRNVKAVQRAEKSATDFAIVQSTVTEVAEGFLRNMEIENGAVNEGFAQEV